MRGMSAPRLLSALALCVAVGATPTVLLAQHGTGHGFHTGGLHAGGGGSHLYGGHHGGGYYGGYSGYWHGGYYGWHRGYWGYPRYGWGYPYYGYGWGFSIGFGWPYPYSPAYPYWYGYGSGAIDPTPPRYYSPCDYRYQCRCAANDRDCNTARYAPQAKNMVPRPPITTNASVKSGSVLNQSPEMNAANRLPRREVQNALNVLRGMPPASRQRWIDSGRYSSFSPEERDLLKHVSDERALATTRSTATESGQH